MPLCCAACASAQGCMAEACLSGLLKLALMAALCLSGLEHCRMLCALVPVTNPEQTCALRAWRPARRWSSCCWALPSAGDQGSGAGGAQAAPAATAGGAPCDRSIPPRRARPQRLSQPGSARRGSSSLGAPGGHKAVCWGGRVAAPDCALSQRWHNGGGAGVVAGLVCGSVRARSCGAQGTGGRAQPPEQGPVLKQQCG